MKKICPDCKEIMEKVEVLVEDATTKATSWQCPKCEYSEFEEKSTKKVLEELQEKESHTQVEVTLSTLPDGRLGLAIDKATASALRVHSGSKVWILPRLKSKTR